MTVLTAAVGAATAPACSLETYHSPQAKISSSQLDLAHIEATLEFYGIKNRTALWQGEHRFNGALIEHGYEIEIPLDGLRASLASRPGHVPCAQPPNCEQPSQSLIQNFGCLFRPESWKARELEWQSLSETERADEFRRLHPRAVTLSKSVANHKTGPTELRQTLKHLLLGADDGTAPHVEVNRRGGLPTAEQAWNEEEALLRWLGAGAHTQHHVSFRAKGLGSRKRKLVVDFWAALAEFTAVAFACAGWENARYLANVGDLSSSTTVPTASKLKEINESLRKRHLLDDAAKFFTIGLRDINLLTRESLYNDLERLGFEVRLPKWRATRTLNRWTVELILAFLHKLERWGWLSGAFEIRLGRIENSGLPLEREGYPLHRLSRASLMAGHRSFVETVPGVEEPRWSVLPLWYPLSHIENRVYPRFDNKEGIANLVQARQSYLAKFGDALTKRWEGRSEDGSMLRDLPPIMPRSVSTVPTEVPSKEPAARFVADRFPKWCTSSKILQRL